MSVNKITTYTPVYTNRDCPRKIRDKEQSDVNEFLECHIEKVSSDGSKARGGNCDTRLDKNAVSFKGGRANILKYALSTNPLYDSAVFTGKIARFLDLRRGEVAQYSSKLKKHKMPLLYSLAEKFNTDSFYNKLTDAHQDKKLVFDIYNKIKYPQKAHLRLINDTNYSSEQLNNIIDLTNKAPEKLSLADNLLSTYPSKNKSTLGYEVLEKFLKTDSSKEIAQHYNDYRPYIVLNTKNNFVVEDLEQEIKKGYDKAFYAKKLDITNLLSYEGVASALSPQFLQENYNKFGIALLKKANIAYAGNYNMQSQNISDLQKELAFMYKSTTAGNMNIRSLILNFVETKFGLNDKFQKAPLKSINKVFEVIDKDKEAQKFVYNSLKAQMPFESVEQIARTLESADLKKLNSRMDLVEYALLNKMNLDELSKCEFSELDKHLKRKKRRMKRELEKSYCPPNPFAADIHNLKVKFNGFIDRLRDKFNK